MEDRVRFALEKLLNVAHGDSHQGSRVANFVLAWWNAEVHGGFDLTDLANVDRDVAEDMVTVFTWMAREEDLQYPDAYKPEIAQIIRRWRPHIEID
ncbi:hypothetical protein J2T09_003395 [Neorhizobium huautlense]|uniref:DUF7673 domain-containing protein n=1 Tax=Neorhizobium huautlense TaxID=67774 RepID=A0ABT9PWY2_9HYPH|nr:hypothetical protein [Neorhizobium huautlense]MDP9838623.1 hypothetical protein [Neorhizobium huautlense]